jgi:hypothetical protein
VRDTGGGVLTDDLILSGTQNFDNLSTRTVRGNPGVCMVASKHGRRKPVLQGGFAMVNDSDNEDRKLKYW